MKEMQTINMCNYKSVSYKFLCIRLGEYLYLSLWLNTGLQICIGYNNVNYQSVWTFLHNVIWLMDMIQLHNPLAAFQYSNKVMLKFILIALIQLVDVMVS